MRAVFVLLVVAASLNAGYERPLIFGINPPANATVEEVCDRMVEAGATAGAVGFDWCNMEPSPGVYDLSYREDFVNAAIARGMQVYCLVATTPGWANETGQNDIYRPLESAADEFHDFCVALAEYYQGRISCFQFWNEPDVGGWKPAPNVEEYTRWLVRFNAAIKEGNPSAKVGLGGLLGRSMSFIEGVYANGGGDAFDAVGIHPYADEYIDLNFIRNVRSVLVAHGQPEKEIWISEYGWATDPDLQARYVKYSLDALARSEFFYVTWAFHHTLGDWAPDVTMGLCDYEFNRKPAFYAFQEMATATSPIITDTAAEPSDTTCVVTWKTDVPSTSKVEYGLTESYGSATPTDPALVTEHSVTLTGLTPWTDYHYRAVSTAGDQTRYSLDFTFRTLPQNLGPFSNGGFEGGTLERWGTFGRTDGVIEEPAPGGTYAYEGSRMYGAMASWDNKNGGIYQPFSVTPGQELTVSVWVHTYQEGGAEWDEGCALGFDPTGGTDPEAASVVWSDWETTPNDGPWEQVTLGPFTVRSPVATVFLKHMQKWPLRWNVTLFDAAQVSILPDTSAPAQVSGVELTPGGLQMALSWTNPSDADFMGTIVCFSTEDYPATPDDGTRLCDRQTEPGASDSFVHVGVDPGTRYYYSFFTYDEVPNYSEAYHATAVGHLESTHEFPAGWSMTSIPLIPDDWEAAAVLDDVEASPANTLAGSLWRFDGAYRSYPGDFTLLAPGEGYWLNLVEPVTEVLCGARRTEPAQVVLSAGWNLVGYPFDTAQAWAGTSLTDGVQTLTVPQAVAAGWILGLLYTYAEEGGGYTIVTTEGESTRLVPWRGYWLKALRAGLTWIIPVP